MASVYVRHDCFRVQGVVEIADDSLNVEITVIVHGSLSIVWSFNTRLCYQMIAQFFHSFIGEDAEDFSLMIVEFSRRCSTKRSQTLMKECLYTCQAEMGKTRTVVEQGRDALKMLVS